jgi:hypothetical protein
MNRVLRRASPGVGPLTLLEVWTPSIRAGGVCAALMPEGGLHSGAEAALPVFYRNQSVRPINKLWLQSFTRTPSENPQKAAFSSR